MSSRPDAELMALSAKGETTAFAELVYFHRICRNMLPAV